MFFSTLAATFLLLTLAVAKQPNILFMFTDDQDLELGLLNYLHAVTSRVQQQGFTFENHYATVALCCPSRVAMLRGQHAHNTNITDVGPPGGGYSKFNLANENLDYLPQWLNKAGYRTEYIGKIMNGYGIWNYFNPPSGWAHFDGMPDPFMYTYNTAVFSANGAVPRYYPQAYLTDVIHAKAVDRMQTLIADGDDKPWFLMLAPTAPHQEFNSTGKWPPVPAARHANLFPGLQAPRTPNFNPATQHKPSWVGQLPLMDDKAIQFSDATYRGRAQALQSIDEMAAHLLDILEETGEIDNTVVMFSSDHGYHVGQHRVPCGKTLPYREDTHIPFFMRGPGIPVGQTDTPSNHIDIAPTILTLAQLDSAQWPNFLDGRSLVPYWSGAKTGLPVMYPANGTNSTGPDTIESVNVEFWGQGTIEATGLDYNATEYPNNSYKTLRIVSQDYGYLYSVWCTGETELYDTVADPYELTPLNNSTANVSRLTSRLNGLMLLLKTCIGDTCRDPWSTLHPSGDVHSLNDALDPSYDAYYASLPSVHFDACLDDYQVPNEEPYFPGTRPLSMGPLSGADSSLNSTAVNWKQTIPADGFWGQQYEDLATLEVRARDLTAAELEYQGDAVGEGSSA